MTASLIINNARIVDPANGLDCIGGIAVKDGRILAAGPGANNQGAPENAEIIDARDLVAAPGLVDICVSIGEPGSEQRETFITAGRAAVRGGITSLICEPGTKPVIDDPAIVTAVLQMAGKATPVNIHVMAALTRQLQGREMSEIGLLQEAGAIAFSDGSLSIQNSGVMRRLLDYSCAFNALIVHQPKDNDLAADGIVNEGLLASHSGLPSLPREAESITLERDLRLAGLTGARYHARLISCAQSVSAMRRALADGFNVSAGVSINNLTLNENDIGSFRTYFKLSPPLRAEEDRMAMVEALSKEIVTIITSNHDPQHMEKKRRTFAEARDGSIGLETLLPAALRLYHSEDLSLKVLIKALSLNPARRFGLDRGSLAPGKIADLVLFDPEKPWIYDRHSIRSKSRNTVFRDVRFLGKIMQTYVDGRRVFDAQEDAEAEAENLRYPGRFG